MIIHTNEQYEVIQYNLRFNFIPDIVCALICSYSVITRRFFLLSFAAFGTWTENNESVPYCSYFELYSKYICQVWPKSNLKC